MGKRVYRYYCSKCNTEWTVGSGTYHPACPNCGESEHVMLVGTEEE